MYTLLFRMKNSASASISPRIGEAVLRWRLLSLCLVWLVPTSCVVWTTSKSDSASTRQLDPFGKDQVSAFPSSIGICCSTGADNDMFTRMPSRRDWLVGAVAGLTVSLAPLEAVAKGPPPMSVQETVEAVCFELQDGNGSVGRLQAALDASDFAGLLEITKTMDQSLRKKVVGQAKYYWEDKNAGTQLSNNVTFDLIGMNRNARPGQESAEGVQRYLQELRNDLQKILEYSEAAAAAAITTTTTTSAGGSTGADSE